MLDLINPDSRLTINKTDTGYKLKFTVNYDSDNDDTISYELFNNYNAETIRCFLSNKSLMQMKTDNRDIDLLIGLTKRNPIEVFFSIMDYASETREMDTKKVYIVNIEAWSSDYDYFDKIIRAIVKDKKEAYEYEHKSNTIKH